MKKTKGRKKSPNESTLEHIQKRQKKVDNLNRDVRYQQRATQGATSSSSSSATASTFASPTRTSLPPPTPRSSDRIQGNDIGGAASFNALRDGLKELLIVSVNVHLVSRLEGTIELREEHHGVVVRKVLFVIENNGAIYAEASVLGRPVEFVDAEDIGRPQIHPSQLCSRTSARAEQSNTRHTGSKTGTAKGRTFTKEDAWRLEEGTCVRLLDECTKKVRRSSKKSRKKRSKKVKSYNEIPVHYNSSTHKMCDIRLPDAHRSDRYREVQEYVTVSVALKETLSFFTLRVCGGAAVSDWRKQLSLNAQHRRQLNAGVSAPATPIGVQQYERSFIGEPVYYDKQAGPWNNNTGSPIVIRSASCSMLGCSSECNKCKQIRLRALQLDHEERLASETSNVLGDFKKEHDLAQKTLKNKRDYQRRKRLTTEALLEKVATILSEGDAAVARDIASTVGAIINDTNNDVPIGNFINAEKESLEVQDLMLHAIQMAMDCLRGDNGGGDEEEEEESESDEEEEEEENTQKKYLNDVENLVKNGYLAEHGINAKYMAALLMHTEYTIQRAKEGKSVNGVRYSTEVWSAAVQILRACKPKGYDLIRTIIPLPHRKTLDKYSSIPTPDHGIDSQSVNLLKEKLDKLNDACKIDGHTLVAVSIDAATMSNRCYLDRNTGRVIGFADPNIDLKHVLNGFDKDFFDKGDLAKYVNIVMVCSLGKSREAFPVGAYISTTMTADILDEIVDETIDALAEKDIAVGIITADGASENRKMMQQKMDVTVDDIRVEITKRHGNKGGQPIPPLPQGVPGDFPVAMRHPCFENIFIFFNSDPPHLLKKLRNAVIHSGERLPSNSYTRHLEHSGKHIGIQMW